MKSVIWLRLYVIISFFQVFGAIGVMSHHMSGSLAQLNIGTAVCHVNIALSDSISAALLLTLIPLLDLILVPFLRYTTINPSILKRLGFGTALAVMSMFSLFLIEVVGSYNKGVMSGEGDAVCMFSEDETQLARLAVNVYWLLPSLLIVTIAEIFIFIPSM